MASSSSSHQQNHRFNNAFSGIEPDGKRRKVAESSKLFDVFINHRGPDVKLTLATHLYNSLIEVGIRAFLDSEEKQLGESFPSTIETAIKSAKVHIAILSKRYAESPWCLAELALMLQTQAKIIPVFYEVQPWELRFIEKGGYANAFTEYENKRRYLEKLPEWKEALQSLSFVAGEEFNGDYKNIIAAVQKEIQKKTRLHVATYPVGLDDLVEDFERRSLDELVQDFENQCELVEGGHKSKVVGIFGMGGAGKTTLAKELFNRKSSNYYSSSFLFDVREASTAGRLPSLQGKLLKDLFQDHLNPTSTEEGMGYLNDCLQRSPNLNFLIVVDDIDHVEQLNALMIMDVLNKYGNILVIVTTRDVGVLIRAGITNGYHLKGLDRNNGRELFCWHAFGQSHSSSGYEVLVDAFVDVCGGLPLSLQVLGRHVNGKPDTFWNSALIKVRETLPRDVKQRLRISFDALDDEEKQVFMDVACFFVGKSKSIAERVWEGSGWNAQYALEILKDKCLVEETTEILSLNLHEGLILKMHDHLRDLGREIAVELKPPHRLWCPKYLNYLESLDFKSILGKTHGRCFHSIFDRSMSSQVTFFIGQSNICLETSASLLWLELQGNSTKQQCIPSWISLQNVQCLKIKHGQLKTLWENRLQAPSLLKELHTSETVLEKIPDFSGISDSLEKVFLDARGWSIQGLPLLESLSMNLCSLCVSFSTLKGEQVSSKTEERTTCESLVILNFKFSGEVAWNNGGRSSSVRAPMGSLEKLEISGEELVSKILISGIHYPSLESIKLYCMENLMEVDLISIKKLNCLDITNCKHLKSLSGISNLAKLELLNISQCPELEELSLGHVSCLKRITVVHCKHLKRVSGSSDIRNSVELNVNCFRELVANDFFSSVSGLDGFRMLVQLNISECPELEELRLEHLSCLEKISIEKCCQLETVSGINDLAKLVELEIFDCGKVEFECFRLSGMRCLQTIVFDRNVKVKRFEVDDCQHLKTINYGCEEIARFDSSHYPERERLLMFEDSICLVGVIINRCGEFKYLRLIDCQNLKTVSVNYEIGPLHIMNCPRLVELQSFSSLSYAEEVDIASCGKLQNIMLPTSLTSLYLESCSDLQRVSTTGDLTMLTQLRIRECPELVELPSFSSLSCIKEIDIGSCGKLENIMLPTSLTSLCFRHCEKLQNIMLPTSLTSLYLESCSDLHRVSTTGDLTMLNELSIRECPELVELPSFSSLRCIKEIDIRSCGKLENIMLPTSIMLLTSLTSLCFSYCEKLENIMLPTSLTSLYLESCSDLQRVSTTGDLTMLNKLRIRNCPELVELPNFSSLSCAEEIDIRSRGKLQNIMLPTKLFLNTIEIHSSEKLQNMAGIEELHVIREMRLCYCSNAVIRNCIDKLKRVPGEGVVIGRAVDGAESCLNEYLFPDAHILTVTDIAENFEDWKYISVKWRGLNAILCCLVVDSSASLEDINKRRHLFSGIYLRHGEWIITMTVGRIMSNGYPMREISEALKRHGTMKKGFLIGVREDEEWKCIQILQKIVGRLYHL